jgi:hypothetical protein
MPCPWVIDVRPFETTVWPHLQGSKYLRWNNSWTLWPWWMKPPRCLEMSGTIFPATRRHIPGGRRPHTVFNWTIYLNFVARAVWDINRRGVSCSVVCGLGCMSGLGKSERCGIPLCFSMNVFIRSMTEKYEYLMYLAYFIPFHVYYFERQTFFLWFSAKA